MPEISGMIQEYLEGQIKTIGRAPVIESKTITENGTYTAPESIDGYSPIVVNVPAPLPIVEAKTITENGTYTAPEGVDGYSPVTVDVPIPSIIPVTLTENGTYTNYDGNGFNPITVAVPTVQKMANYFNQFNSASMSIIYNLNGLDITWNGGESIDCRLSCFQDIKNKSKLDVILTTGTSYYNTYGAHPVRELYVGLTGTYYSPNTSPTSVTWLELHQVHDDNTTYTFSFDLTEIDAQNIYIFISANGWNINDMQLSLS